MRAKFGNGLPRPEFDEIGIGPESRVPRSVHRLVIHLVNKSNVGDPVGPAQFMLKQHPRAGGIGSDISSCEQMVCLAACIIFDGLLPLLYLLPLYREKKGRGKQNPLNEKPADLLFQAFRPG